MKNYKPFSFKGIPGVVVSVLATAIIFCFPVTGAAYLYQNSEYKFEISTPEKPAQITSANGAIGLDLSQGGEEYPIWLIQQDKKNQFIDPTTLSESKQQEYFTLIAKEDYGEAKAQRADIIRVGKYNGTLLVNKDGKEIMAMAMFKTEQNNNFIVSLLTTENRFEEDFKIYQQYLETFAEL